jgi:hypothetical protein
MIPRFSARRSADPRLGDGKSNPAKTFNSDVAGPFAPSLQF